MAAKKLLLKKKILELRTASSTATYGVDILEQGVPLPRQHQLHQRRIRHRSQQRLRVYSDRLHEGIQIGYMRVLLSHFLVTLLLYRLYKIFLRTFFFILHFGVGILHEQLWYSVHLLLLILVCLGWCSYIWILQEQRWYSVHLLL